MNRALVHFITTAVLVAGSLLVGWVCVTGWSSAWMPVGMFLCGVCLPLLSFGAISAKLNAAQGVRLADVGVWGVQAALLTAALAAWSSPQTRISAARLAPTAALGSCLHDVDGAVVRACCEQLGQDATGHQAVLGRWLIDHERGPMACAVQSFDGRTPEANTTARVLVERWEARLLAPQQPAPNAAPALASSDAPSSSQDASLCEIASYIRHMDRVPGTYSGLRLLQCALRAQEPEAQQCCAAQLHQLSARSQDWRDALGPPELTQRTNQASRLLLLLPLLLNPPDERAAEQLRAMRLDTPGARRWSVEAACSLLDHETPRVRAEASAHLQLWLLMRGCDEVTGLGPRDVVKLCARWGEARAPEAEGTQDEALMCQLTRGEATAQATQHARVFMARARGAARGAARSEDPLVRAILSARVSRPTNLTPTLDPSYMRRLQSALHAEGSDLPMEDQARMRQLFSLPVASPR